MGHDQAIPLVVRGLGRAEISLGALTLVPDAGMLFPLALLLAQRAGERLSRAELREWLWPEAPEAAGRHSLRQALYRLRRAGLATHEQGDEVAVDPAVVDSDLTAMMDDAWPAAAAARDIESAGTVLPGFAPDAGTALGAFADQLRARVAAQHRRAVLARIAATRREGRWREVEHWALCGLQADPLNEEATLARAEALAMVGAKFEALALLDAYLRELGDRAKVIGLPARLLRRRISELADPSGRRVTATSAPFVGRHELLARAQDALAEARRGAATALWFTGPSGIGKSRLLREVERASRMAGWTVVRGWARPSHVDRPFALLTDFLPGLLDAPGALGAAPHALSLLRKLGTVTADEEPLPPEEARVRQWAVYHAWMDLMDAVLAETPLALVLDDAHWSDPLTLQVLSRFMEARPAVRLAVVLCARRVPERDEAAAVGLLAASEARVGPLTEEEIHAYTSAAGLAADDRFEEVTRQLGRTSGGNPLFLSHLVHQHQQPGGGGQMPPDLATLIDTQLRTLSREATRLLQACALLGAHAQLPRIERALGVAAPALVSAFAELDDMLALPTDAGAPLAPHDLWTERVRRGITSGVLRSLAVSVARVLESDAAADGSIDLYWDAARLYRESGEKQLAYATMMRCAEYLMRTGAAAEANRAYLAASELALTPSAATAALMGRVRTLRVMGEWHDVLQVAETLGDQDHFQEDSDEGVELAMIVLEAIQFTTRIGNGLDRLVSIANDGHTQSAQRLHAAFVGMTVADNLHDASTLRVLMEHASDIPPFEGDESARLRIRLVYEGSVGSLSLAVEHANALLRSVRSHRNTAARISTLRTASFAFRRIGQYARAKELIAESGRLAAKADFTYAQFRAFDLLAGIALEYGELGEAHAALLEAERHLAQAHGAFNRDSLSISWVFWAIDSGDWEQARQRLSTIESIDLGSRSRHALLPAAASLRVQLHFQKDDDARKTLSAILDHGPSIYVHSAVDQVALAVALGLGKYQGPEEARIFAAEFLSMLRRDLMPPPQLLLAVADQGTRISVECRGIAPAS